MNLLYTFLFVLIGMTVHAQSIILYGLKSQAASNPNGQVYPMNLVRIDPFTSDIDSLFEIDNSFAVAVGSSTFDHSRGNFIYWGPDDQNTYSIFSVSVGNQNIQSNPATTSHPIELEFDLETGTTYGLSYDNDNNLQTLVSIDLADGSSTVVATLPDISAVAIGSSTYDSNGKRFIFQGVSQSGAYKLVSVNVLDGSVSSAPVINQQGEPRINFFEYDNRGDKLFSMYTVEDESQFDSINFMAYYNTYLAEVDIVSGVATPLGSAPILSGYFAGIQVGGVGYDQSTQTYVLRGSSGNGFVLSMIDATTGNIISEVPSPETVLELQIDNLNFAREFYNLSSLEENQLTESFKVFPNPVENELEVMIDIESTGTVDLEIVNALGNRILNRSAVSTSNINFPISGLASGTYFLRIIDEKGNRGIRSFIKL